MTDFRFVCDKKDEIRAGKVIERADEMVLVVPFRAGGGEYTIKGERRHHWFEGDNLDRRFPVHAKWADVGDMFVGVWDEGERSLFSFPSDSLRTKGSTPS